MKHNSSHSRFHRFFPIMAVFAFLASVMQVPAGPNELGAYVRGIWDSTAIPEVSLVLFRWGTADTALNGKDRMLGQIAAIDISRVTIKMRTPEGSPIQYEVELTAGVQIFGEGFEASCTECPRRRKYNGTTLVSRGAYNSQICCFNAVFDQCENLNTLDITDVVADGRSVPYMVKFTTQPTLHRLGQKVMIPTKSTLHHASVAIRRVESSQNSTSFDGRDSNHRNSWSSSRSYGSFSDGTMEEIGNGTRQPEYSVWGSSCLAEPFEVMRGGERVSDKISFSFPNTGSMSVSGPGFKMEGIDCLKQFCTALGVCWRTGKAMERNVFRESDFSAPKPILSANFPVIVTTTSGGTAKPTSIRSVLAAQGTKQDGSLALVVRIEALDASGKSGMEVFSIPIDWIPGIVKILNPREPMQRMR